MITTTNPETGLIEVRYGKIPEIDKELFELDEQQLGDYSAQDLIYAFDRLHQGSHTHLTISTPEQTHYFLTKTEEDQFTTRAIIRHIGYHRASKVREEKADCIIQTNDDDVIRGETHRFRRLNHRTGIRYHEGEASPWGEQEYTAARFLIKLYERKNTHYS